MSDDITPEQAKAWRQREEERFRDGTYTRLPTSWMHSEFFCAPQAFNGPDKFVEYYNMHLFPLRYPDHYAHISIEKVAMIAFTENDKKGMADRQTRMSPGRYLTRFFSDVLDKNQIQQLATEMGSIYNDDAELAFAITADEFERVYVNGPHSCMQYPAEHFASRIHPARIYAGHDLQLAYLKRDGRITARALAWPEKLVYGRVYGDGVRLEAKLKAAGYGEGNDGALLGGAKITKLMKRGMYVIPYLDHLEGARDDGEYLTLMNDGMRGHCDVGANCQNGLDGNRFTCETCDESYDGDDDSYTGPNGEQLCECCYNDNYTICGYSGEVVRIDDVEDVRTRLGTRRNGERYWYSSMWCERSRDRAGYWCEMDEVWYSSDAGACAEIDGMLVGPEALWRDYAFCADTNKYALKADTVTLENGTIWSKEHFIYHGTEVNGKRYAVAELDEYGQVPPVVVPSHGYELRHEPMEDYPWKVYHNNGRIDGWQRRASAEAFIASAIARDAERAMRMVQSTTASTSTLFNIAF